MLKLVISTPNNPERAENVRRQMESQGIVGYELVEANMIYKHPPRGISESFKKCIRLAKDRGAKSVNIFEDDILFLTPTSYEDFLFRFRLMWHDEVDIFLGGFYDGTPVSVKPGVARIDDKLSGLHCIIVNDHFYDKFLEADENINLDWVLSEQFKARIYAMYPMGIIQQDGYSFNARQVTNYNEHLGKRYKLLNQQ